MDHQGFVAFVESIKDDDLISGQFDQNQVILLEAQSQRHQQMAQAMQQLAAQQRNAQQLQQNAALGAQQASPGAPVSGPGSATPGGNQGG